ncbi:MAG TPA: hypothetical protein VEJ63_14250, partial [Planctomycetota bacterium]|nr:hypothetical protein [Planctomycetota bacterium]
MLGVVACGSAGLVWRRWEPWQLTTVLNARPGSFHYAAFSPEGDRILTFGAGGSRIWSASTGECLAHFKTDGQHWVAQFAPDGHRVVTSDHDNRGEVWNALTGARLRQLEGTLVSGVWADSGNHLLVWGNSEWKLVNIETGKCSRNWLRRSTEDIHTSWFFPTGDRLVTGHADGFIRVWNTADGANLASIKAHEEALHRMDYSPDYELLISSPAGGTEAIVWDTTTWKQIH